MKYKWRSRGIIHRMTRKPLLLVILDGFGVSIDPKGNPVAEAKKPTLEMLEREFPFTTLQASGVAVGLPWGEAGNSEVGHLTIGSGRVIYHHLPRIINAIADESFFKNEAFLGAAAHVKKNNTRFHIAGLVSSGSVHAYIDHLYAILDFTKQQGIAEVYLHLFSDGKDAPPQEGATFYEALEERLQRDYPHARIASLIGRFYALDRGEQWERTQIAYALLTEGKGEIISSVPEYLSRSYKEGLADETIRPALVADAKGTPLPRIAEGDALIFTDFREDSMRQLAHAFGDVAFDHFPRKKVENLFLATMTEYEKGLAAHPAFPQFGVAWPLARVLGDAGLRHLHIAETQKYAHVTYFFNGGIEKPFPDEERVLIPSAPAAHFDEAPEMRAPDITQKIIQGLDTYDVIIANYANADMVGHSGNFQAAIRAVEAIDAALGELANAILSRPNAVMIVTGDHGNVELKRHLVSGEKRTEHSLSPVYCILVGKEFRRAVPRTSDEVLRAKKEVGGILTDIAPTIIELLGLKKPAEMTGESLIKILL